MPPVVYGLSSGTTALPSSGLTIGAADLVGQLQHLAAGARQPRPARMATFVPALMMSAASCSSSSVGTARRWRVESRAVAGDVGLGALLAVAGPVLDVLGDGDVGDGAPRQGGLDRLVHDVVHVRRPHDPLVVGGHVHEQLVEVDVLLVVRADQVVEGVAGDGEDRLAVALGVVQAVEQVNAAGAGGGQADAEAAGVLGVAAGGEGGGLLVPHLDEPQLVLVRRAAPRRCR